MSLVQRLTLSQIETDILRITGYSASTLAPWLTSANLYLRVNAYIQALPVKLAQLVSVLRESGKMPPGGGVPRWDMWRTEGTVDCKAGVSQAVLPEDYDTYVSFWNALSNDPIDVVENVAKYHIHLKKKPAGPIEAVEIMGSIPQMSAPMTKRVLNLYPTPSVDQAIQLVYWRIPRAMPGSSATTEYPDIPDPRYEQLAVFGPAVELLRPNDPDYERYLAAEQNLLRDAALTARA